MPNAYAHHPQRGAAALPAVMILFFVLVLIVLYANRGLIFEQRTSANQYRSTQAFETAEAGLEWALASLNNHKSIDAACAVDATAASSFKGRYTAIDATTGTITPTAGAVVRAAACVVNGDGTFSCACPTAGNPAPNGVGAVFAVQLAAASPAQPGVMQIIVHGCTSTGTTARDPRCIPGGGSTGTSDSYAKVSVSVGILPALATAPGATITAKTTVGWTGAGAGVGVINSDPSSNGITINAGGAVDESHARIVTIPGSPPASSIIENDPSLQALSDDAMFQTFFGVSRDVYKSLATVLTCAGNCANTLEAAVNGSDGPFWVEGDLDVNSNVSIGSVDKPIVLVVNGNIHLNGTMDVFGLVYSTSLTWNNTGGGSAFLRGAAVAEGAFTGNGTPDFYFDATLLRTLSTTMGSFAKIPGSWKDF
jgi:hypothetical protein